MSNWNYDQIIFDGIEVSQNKDSTTILLHWSNVYQNQESWIKNLNVK